MKVGVKLMGLSLALPFHCCFGIAKPLSSDISLNSQVVQFIS